ncbi:MAG: metallophosphoesterase [Rhodobacteraceae bacterium]|nr:metallophosphoesterase [Paracoccaceae bacterium]
MRILVVSDLHYALKQFDWLKARAPGFDLVVIAGDLLEVSSIVDRRAQLVVVSAYLRQISQLTRVAICSGNHDLTDRRADGEAAAAWQSDLARDGILADGNSQQVGDVCVTACPWWDGPATRDEIGVFLQGSVPSNGQRWLWLYHAPPSDSVTAWDGARSFGDVALRGWIEKFSPDWVLAGHVHQAPFVKDGGWVDRVDQTWVFNTGQQPGPEPAHIALDLDAGRAYWVSMEGTESIDLNDPSAKPIPLTEWPAILA